MTEDAGPYGTICSHRCGGTNDDGYTAKGYPYTR
jgi:hypothetical protein